MIGKKTRYTYDVTNRSEKVTMPGRWVAGGPGPVGEPAAFDEYGSDPITPWKLWEYFCRVLLRMRAAALEPRAEIRILSSCAF